MKSYLFWCKGSKHFLLIERKFFIEMILLSSWPDFCCQHFLPNVALIIFQFQEGYSVFWLVKSYRFYELLLCKNPNIGNHFKMEVAYCKLWWVKDGGWAVRLDEIWPSCIMFNLSEIICLGYRLLALTIHSIFFFSLIGTYVIVLILFRYSK